jgi:hypothetical protein
VLLLAGRLSVPDHQNVIFQEEFPPKFFMQSLSLHLHYMSDTTKPAQFMVLTVPDALHESFALLLFNTRVAKLGQRDILLDTLCLSALIFLLS